MSSIHRTAWPSYDEEIAAEDMATIVFQVNGKLRDRAGMPVGTPKKELGGNGSGFGKSQEIYRTAGI